MDTAKTLEAYAEELTTAARTLANYHRGREVRSTPATASSPQSVVPPDAPVGVHQARQAVLRTAAKLEALLREPADFVQHLALQNQIVACLQWLGDFQILACIPRAGTVGIKDVAQLCAVPEAQLSRVIRMTATAGFLHEPQAGHVSHTSLSAKFVSKPSLADAAMFLAERAAPAALQMASTTRRTVDRVEETTYNLAFNGFQLFPHACEQRPRLARQWTAYLQHAATGATGSDDLSDEVLGRLDWANLGAACVVDVGAPSADFALSLANLYPNLHFVVQTSPQQQLTPVEPSISASTPAGGSSATTARVALQTRTLGAPQTVHDAAVYILRLPAPRLAVSSRKPAFPSQTAQIGAELRAHLAVLVASSRATLIVTPARLLPEPGSVDADIEAGARMRDLSLFQLTNERELEVAELSSTISNVGDGVGRLVVVNELRARNNVLVAVGVKYQLYANPAIDVQTTLIEGFRSG